MQWTLSETIGLAKMRCEVCGGSGLHETYGQKLAPCNCVYRAIFRACYHKFLECAQDAKYLTAATTEPCYGPEYQHKYSMKTEEYMADFCLIGKRTLDEEDYRLFRFRYLLGANW